jgi:hypothetical protein
VQCGNHGRASIRQSTSAPLCLDSEEGSRVKTIEELFPARISCPREACGVTLSSPKRRKLRPNSQVGTAKPCSDQGPSVTWCTKVPFRGLGSIYSVRLMDDSIALIECYYSF